MHDISDEALLRAYQGGDSAAFRRLFDRYRQPLFNYLLRRIRNHAQAEELYQEVWTKVIERSMEFRGDAKFATWMYTIARNRCVDHQRRMKLRLHLSLDAPSRAEGVAAIEELGDSAPATDVLAEGLGLRERLASAVEALPDDQKDVFLLRRLQGLAFGDIAEVVDAPVNTVKSRLRYALERLQHQLSDLRETE